MAYLFTEVASSQWKKVLYDLTKDLNLINISLASNGLVQHKDYYICSKTKYDSTQINMFYFTTDMEQENLQGQMLTTSSTLLFLRPQNLPNHVPAL